MSKSTPTKDTSGGGSKKGFCHAVERLPTPKTCGNESKDREVMDRHNLFQRMVQGLIDDLDDIISAYTAWQGKKSDKDDDKSSDDCFVKISTLGRLEVPFQVFFISQRTTVMV